MISRIVVLLLVLTAFASAFTPKSNVVQQFSQATLGAKKDDDLSFLETRDMTREEMLALNAENEKIMNAELVGMTAFSLIISIPMLYLVWVAFFSETAGDFDY